MAGGGFPLVPVWGYQVEQKTSCYSHSCNLNTLAYECMFHRIQKNANKRKCDIRDTVEIQRLMEKGEGPGPGGQAGVGARNRSNCLQAIPNSFP